MGHGMNEWIGHLTVPAGVVAMLVVVHFRLGAWRTVAILLPIFGLLVMIVANLGPRAKGLVEGLKSRFR